MKWHLWADNMKLLKSSEVLAAQVDNWSKNRFATSFVRSICAVFLEEIWFGCSNWISSNGERPSPMMKGSKLNRKNFILMKSDGDETSAPVQEHSINIEVRKIEWSVYFWNQLVIFWRPSFVRWFNQRWEWWNQVVNAFHCREKYTTP